MKLIECPSCHEKISDEAEACPHCGYPLAKKQKEKAARAATLGCLGVLAIIILIGVLLSFFGGGPETPQKQEAAAPSGDKTISGEHWFGCSDREVYEKLVGFAADKDTEAFNSGLAAQLLSGQCKTFQSGETVIIADTAIFSGMVKVRPKGDVTEYWTALEAVK